MDHPKLIVFTAPSGAGKTTLVMHLMKVRNDLAFSISGTTRSPRYDEVNGMHYYFLSSTEFKKKIDEGDFIEFEEVNLGKNVLFDIDVKGAVNIKKYYGDRCLTVFVRPPSPEVLIDRLKNRKTEDEESLKKRIARAREELTYESKFDVTIINDDLQTAMRETEEIVDKFIQFGIDSF